MNSDVCTGAHSVKLDALCVSYMIPVSTDAETQGRTRETCHVLMFKLERKCWGIPLAGG